MEIILVDVIIVFGKWGRKNRLFHGITLKVKSVAVVFLIILNLSF